MAAVVLAAGGSLKRPRRRGQKPDYDLSSNLEAPSEGEKAGAQGRVAGTRW